eukprot:IDg13255t1
MSSTSLRLWPHFYRPRCAMRRHRKRAPPRILCCAVLEKKKTCVHVRGHMSSNVLGAAQLPPLLLVCTRASTKNKPFDMAQVRKRYRG